MLSFDQQSVVSSRVQRLTVRAYAGCGKTFTLKKLAESLVGVKVLYLAYNEAIVTSAKQIFPANVMCRTSHGLCWHDFGLQYKKAGKLRALRTRDVVNSLAVPVAYGKSVKNAVERFLFSSDTKISTAHLDADVLPEFHEAMVADAGKIWEAMQDVSCKSMPMPHDGYLKLFQLSMPDLSRRFDVILFDEAQDANPVTLDILKRQTCRIVMVGDPYQSIYGYRGSVNALDLFQADETLTISETHRFGPRLAHIASVLLAVFRCEEKLLTSANPSMDLALTVDRSRQYAVIARTNAKLFAHAVSLLGRRTFSFVGGLENYPFEKLLGVYGLLSGDKSLITDPIFSEFNSYDEFEGYARDADDVEMLSLIGVTKEYMSRIPELVARIKAEATKEEKSAQVLLSTVHRSKGLEYDQVLLLNDFDKFVTDSGEIIPVNTFERSQELHLLYVAVTRAINSLEINDELRAILDVVEASGFLPMQAASGATQTKQEVFCGDSVRSDEFVRENCIDTCSVSVKSQPEFIDGVSVDDKIRDAVLRYGASTACEVARIIGVSTEVAASELAKMIRNGHLSRRLFTSCSSTMSRVGAFL